VILLLGGTAETAAVARAFINRGWSVLVSTATDIPLTLDDHPQLEKRTGPLDEAGLSRLMEEKDIRSLIDVTHPYALEISRLALKVTGDLRVPYFRLHRPEVIAEQTKILRARDHQQAASFAVLNGAPVLLTTGSKNLDPYVRETRHAGLPLFVRVLPDPHSVQACLKAGIPQEAVITGRGPFSVEENRALIRKYHIGVLVTKDSGLPGGVLEKIEAAEQEGCQVIVVTRSEEKSQESFEGVEELVEAVLKRLSEFIS
jgi:precorrin-6A/cobalt-precorrin-6A reductase